MHAETPPPTPPALAALPPRAVPVAPPKNLHRMRTRAKSGFVQPRKLMAVSMPSPANSPIPANYKIALRDPNWYNAMLEEYNSLVQNKTWSLVSCPAGVNLVSGKWIFRHKLHPDGSLARYKARWALRGFTQQPGVDYGETFSPVVKSATIRVILSLAVSNN
ncbi:uncharacterized mitochondrial protein AtMg00820-like [Aegilops tauschii subsp. strangulata]|uniref:uncharacterized mitochondrial protein AtMg00820-like n=1 Tax=Aegilops tauschii subsp. strangulata TaxID=200361 RepID=UPI000989A9E5|nr:uncharacterized mitochondrial protein AtMg00820-like [Aegilops tauschii subsp. strangulata]